MTPCQKPGTCKLSTAYFKGAASDPKDPEMVTVYYATNTDCKCRCMVIARHITIDVDKNRTVIEEKLYESEALNLKTQKAKHPVKKGKDDVDFWEITAECIE